MARRPESDGCTMLLPGMSQISGLWKELLADISRHLTTKQVRNMIYLCEIPDGTAEKICNALNLLIHLEHKEVISPYDLTHFKKLLDFIGRKDLIQKLDLFEKKKKSIDQSRRQDQGKITGKGRQPVKGSKPLLKPSNFSRDNKETVNNAMKGKMTSKSTTHEKSKKLTQPVINEEASIACREENVSESLLSERQYDTGNISWSNSIQVTSPCPIEDKFKYFVTQGRCLIINNETFNGVEVDGKVLNDRKGTKVDKKKLEETFSWLGFEVHIVDNATNEVILQKLVDFASMDYTNYDAFVCCILSHGFNGGIYAVDGKPIFCDEMRQIFNGKSAEALLGKPKLFFIQACRGDNNDYGGCVSDGPFLPVGRSDTVPNDSDFLFAHATTPGHLSWRNESNGTWFVSILCDVLSEYVKRHVDLSQMLVIVNQKLSEQIGFPNGVRVKQAGEHSVSLTRLLYFVKNAVECHADSD